MAVTCDKLQSRIDSAMNKYDLSIDPYIYYCNSVIPLVKQFVESLSEEQLRLLRRNDSDASINAYYEVILYCFVHGYSIDESVIANMTVNYFPELCGFLPREMVTSAIIATIGKPLINTEEIPGYGDDVLSYFGNFFWCTFKEQYMNLTKKQLDGYIDGNGVLYININYNNDNPRSNYSSPTSKQLRPSYGIVDERDITRYKSYYKVRPFSKPSELYEINSLLPDKYIVALRYNRDNYTICLPNDDSTGMTFDRATIEMILKRDYAGINIINASFIFYNIVDKVRSYLPVYQKKDDPVDIHRLAKLNDPQKIAALINDKHKRFIFMCNIQKYSEAELNPYSILTALKKTFGDVTTQ